MAKKTSFPKVDYNLLGGIIGVNQCSARDNTWYCEFSRIFSSIMMTITILIIFYTLYSLARTFIFNKKGKLK